MLIVLPFSCFAQKECYNTVKYCPHAKKQGYIFNLQSESGAFVQGDTAEVSIIVYKDMEYRISLCSPSHPELDGNFQFKIIEKVRRGEWVETVTYEDVVQYDEYGLETGEEKVEHKTRKRIYHSEDIVRYDNSNDENNQDFIFQSNRTRKLSVKVYVPEMMGEESYELGGDAYSCVGLLIEHQPGVKTGFDR